MASDIIQKVFATVYPAELARKLTEHLQRPPDKPITRQNVHKRLNITGKVPAEWVLGIEAATDGRITRHQLRPDLYPSGK